MKVIRLLALSSLFFCWQSNYSMWETIKDIGTKVVWDSATMVVYFEFVTNNDLGNVEKIIDEDDGLLNLQSEYERNTGLMIASREGHKDLVDYLLRKEADPNLQNIDGWTALMLAANRNHLAIVQALLNAGANHEMKNRDDRTARELAEQGATQVIDDYEMENTELMIASREGHEDIVNNLIVQGVDVNERNAAEWTALMFAANRNHFAIVQALLNAGANHTMQNRDNQTALSIAEQVNAYDAVHAIRVHTEKAYWLKSKLLARWKLIAGLSFIGLGALGYTLWQRSSQSAVTE